MVTFLEHVVGRSVTIPLVSPVSPCQTRSERARDNGSEPHKNGCYAKGNEPLFDRNALWIVSRSPLISLRFARETLGIQRWHR